MAPERRAERAASFGPAASLYDRVRPTYPAAAVEWALAPLGTGRRRVADIGAGTGIMTRVIAGLGHDVVAVEPDELMLEQLAAKTPGVETIVDSAESMPLPPDSLDGAIAAQAYHWFNKAAAHAELARVIRPGGVFAAIWNNRDEATAWVHEYSRIVEGDRGPDDLGADSGRMTPSFSDVFGKVEGTIFHHSVTHTEDSLVELLRSRSYFLTATPERQAALEAQVRALARTHPDLAGRSEFELPYDTLAYRATRLG